ncbi:MAG: AtpZ/AtpI family protein [Planctomycetes bacterium]|nr:AtpZ/AtpI family protein [Planctomycetota bacterium]
MVDPSKTPKPSGAKREEPPLSSVARQSGAAALGMTYGATILVFVGLGWWLDERLGTSPWLLIIGLFLGSGGGFLSLLKKVPPPGS